MRILIITNAYPSKMKPYAGIFVKNQFDRLAREPDFKVEVFYLKRYFTPKALSAVKYFLMYVKYLPKFLRRYDIIHVHFLSPLYVLAYLYKFLHPSTFIVITFHGSDINALNNRYLIRFYKYLLKKNDIAIGVGKSLIEVAEKKLELKLDYFLCAGINDDVFNNIRCNYRAREIDFLYVGSFYEVKGVDLLAEAIRILNNKKIKFVFVGSGPFEADLLELKRERFNVEIKYNLSQPELNSIYNKAKFVVVPSRNEGFGLSLAEGMSCGTPGIIANIEQLKHQVRHMENGLTVVENTPLQLAVTLEYAHDLTADKWKDLSNNALESSKQYSLGEVCRQLADIYRNLSINKS